MQSVRSNQQNGVAPSVLDRAMAVLAAFDGDGRRLGVSELSRRTGLAKSTVHRLAAELVGHGLLERHGTELALGLRLFELGEQVPRQRDLRAAALPYMADLRAATHQTVHLAVLDGVEVVYLEILHSADGPMLPSRVGGRLPAHATAVGKAQLAFSPPEVIDAVLRGPLTRLSTRTATAPGLLRRELARIREQGVAYDHEESLAGVVCAASPLLTTDGSVAGAISVSGRPGRLNVRRMAPAVRTAGLALSRDLAATVPWR